jgi:MbtH protein
MKRSVNGGRDVGVSGPKPICLAHIDEVWVDMRPRSLREAMERAAAEAHPPRGVSP